MVLRQWPYKHSVSKLKEKILPDYQRFSYTNTKTEKQNKITETQSVAYYY